MSAKYVLSAEERAKQREGDLFKGKGSESVMDNILNDLHEDQQLTFYDEQMQFELCTLFYLYNSV